MAHIESETLQCRNCGHEQDYNIVNGILPSLDKSCAVCNKCGFKSVWFLLDLKKFEKQIRQRGYDDLNDVAGLIKPK